MKTILIVSSILLLGGCATSSGVVETGPNTYMITKQAGSGFSGQGTLKADNLRDAGAFCKDQGKVMQITGSQEVAGGFLKFPFSEVQFTCSTVVPPTAENKVLGK